MHLKHAINTLGRVLGWFWRNATRSSTGRCNAHDFNRCSLSFKNLHEMPPFETSVNLPLLHRRGPPRKYWIYMCFQTLLLFLWPRSWYWRIRYLWRTHVVLHRCWARFSDVCLWGGRSNSPGIICRSNYYWVYRERKWLFNRKSWTELPFIYTFLLHGTRYPFSCQAKVALYSAW